MATFDAHDLDVRRSPRLRIRIMKAYIFLTYSSEHLLYTWILLLQYIADATLSRRNQFEVEFHPGPFSQY